MFLARNWLGSICQFMNINVICGQSHDAYKNYQTTSGRLPSMWQPELKKKISAAGFRLTGGWYETDFKTGDKKKNLAGVEVLRDQTTISKNTESAASHQKRIDIHAYPLLWRTQCETHR